MEISIVYPTKFNNSCEIETIIVKTNTMCKKFITILMLKQLIVVKSNEIFVLQAKALLALHVYGRQYLHAGTAAVCEPALFLSRAHTVYLTLWDGQIGM